MANVRGLSDYSGGGGGGRRPGGGGSSGNVRGLGDYSGGAADDSDDDVNELYTGGQKSGQVVKGPPKKAGGSGEVDRLFDRAREHGAVQGTSEDLARARGASVSGGRSVFSGTVRTLDGRNETAPAQPAAPPSQVTHTITFYRNGVFTVDDGPGRGVADPENMEFMQNIMQGVVPSELQPEHTETEVAVNLVRREDDYQPPAQPSFQSFKGTGRKLTADEGGSSAAAAAAPAAAPAPAGEWQGIDNSQPATSLQLRMADGGRMVAQFNLSHTVGDIHRFIRASRPDIAGPVRLMTAFPSQELTDTSQTIEAAGLKNAVVIVKL